MVLRSEPGNNCTLMRLIGYFTSSINTITNRVFAQMCVRVRVRIAWYKLYASKALKPLEYSWNSIKNMHPAWTLLT